MHYFERDDFKKNALKKNFLLNSICLTRTTVKKFINSYILIVLYTSPLTLFLAAR